MSFYKVTCPAGEGKVVDVGFLDFGEAFDTVPHSILLDKLSGCGIAGSRWLGEELPEGQSSECDSEWGYVWLAPGGQRCPSGLSATAGSGQCVYQ